MINVNEYKEIVNSFRQSIENMNDNGNVIIDALQLKSLLETTSEYQQVVFQAVQNADESIQLTHKVMKSMENVDKYMDMFEIMQKNITLLLEFIEENNLTSKLEEFHATKGVAFNG